MHFLGYNMLTKFQFHCSITCRDILYFVFRLPYCHTLWRHQCLICIIQKSWISLERDEIWRQKGKCHSSSLLKAFQIRLFFNTSIFHFIGTLRLNLKWSNKYLSDLLVEEKIQFLEVLTDFSSTFPVNCRAWINLWMAAVVPLPTNTTTSSFPAFTHFLMISL